MECLEKESCCELKVKGEMDLMILTAYGSSAFQHPIPDHARPQSSDKLTFERVVFC